MRLALLVVFLLSLTQLFGYRFQYGGFLESRSLKMLSGNLVVKGSRASELVLYTGISGQDAGKIIYNYSFFVTDPGTNKGTVMRIARWMTDSSTTEILQAIGDDQGEVIGQRLGTVTNDNPFGTPFSINSDTLKLTVEWQYDAESDTGTMKITGEKTLKDGQVIKWEDELQ